MEINMVLIVMAVAISIIGSPAMIYFLIRIVSLINGGKNSKINGVH